MGNPAIFQKQDTLKETIGNSGN